LSQPDQPISPKKPFCFMQMKELPCVKQSVSEKYRKDFRCDQCLWHLHSDAPEHVARMEKLFTHSQILKN
jgi:hypothetical protein